MQVIQFTDYLLLPMYLLVIFYIAFLIRNKKYPVGHPWRPYFLPGLVAKVVGAIFIGLIYQYYYGGGGDTITYFRFGNVINSSFSESPIKWIKLIFHIPSFWDGEFFAYTSQIDFYETTSNYAVCATAAFFMIFSFNTYLVTAVLFAVVAYSGVWAMFRTFATQYPTLIKHLAVAILFIPSTIIWGSSIFKDTICMF